jgi:hypothetical protein
MEKCRMPPGAEPRRAVVFAIDDTQGVHPVGTDIALQICYLIDCERGVAERTGMAAEFVESKARNDGSCGSERLRFGPRAQRDSGR